MTAEQIARTAVIRHRIHAQQLDREPAARPVTDVAVLDLGVQDTGRDAASWALANRGVPLAGPSQLETSDDVALVWSLRGAPHYYRRAELTDVLVAVSPFSEADAAKRVFDASRPLTAAGISTLDGLAEIAGELRRTVTRPMGKGEVSAAIARRLDPPYLRECRVCQAVHAYENPFRLSALYAGLELQPGTSPPVLQRIPGWPRRRPGPAADPAQAPPHLQVIRCYLQLFGPSAAADVAGFLDAPVKVVKQHWPDDAEPVEVGGASAGRLGGLADVAPRGLVRLLGPFDLFLQGRDRTLLVPEAKHRQALWPAIGRPGAVLVADEIIGTWRPRASGTTLTVLVEPWREPSRSVRSRIMEQAERLAAHRGVRLKAVDGVG